MRSFPRAASVSCSIVFLTNPFDLAAKGQFVNANNMKGVTMWTVAGDFNDILIDSVHDAMSITQDCS